MFITLEGIEGAGKTTQIQNIVALLKARGYECVTTREPGGTAIGTQIRGVLLTRPTMIWTQAPSCCFMWRIGFNTSRPLSNQSTWRLEKVVLCDRFFDATLVYQGYAAVWTKD